MDDNFGVFDLFPSKQQIGGKTAICTKNTAITVATSHKRPE